jgi:hypothetical protein
MDRRYWIYAGTTARCLERNTGAIPEGQRNRVRRDASSTARLVVDPDYDEVRGAVPVKRTSQELFFAVVDVEEGGDDPLREFGAVVEAAVSGRSGWNMAYELPEGEVYRELTAERSPAPVREWDVDATADLRKQGYPVELSVPSFRVAARVARELSEEARNAGVEVGTVLVAKSVPADHVDWDVFVAVRDDHRSITLVERE